MKFEEVVHTTAERAGKWLIGEFHTGIGYGYWSYHRGLAGSLYSLSPFDKRLHSKRPRLPDIESVEQTARNLGYVLDSSPKRYILVDNAVAFLALRQTTTGAFRNYFLRNKEDPKITATVGLPAAKVLEISDARYVEQKATAKNVASKALTYLQLTRQYAKRGGVFWSSPEVFGMQNPFVATAECGTFLAVFGEKELAEKAGLYIEGLAVDGRLPYVEKGRENIDKTLEQSVIGLIALNNCGLGASKVAEKLEDYIIENNFSEKFRNRYPYTVINRTNALLEADVTPEEALSDFDETIIELISIEQDVKTGELPPKHVGLGYQTAGAFIKLDKLLSGIV